VTIHSEHPFVPPEGDRDPLRRLRGHLPAPVTVWAAGSGPDRRGLTVSSVLVAAGEPAHVLGLVDEESLLWDEPPETLTVNVLGPGHAYLAEAFAGTAPAPGGPFTQGEWSDSEWGPVLADAAGWLGVRLVSEPPRHVGWGLLLDGVVEHVETLSSEVLTHVRGRYLGGS
jgi:flavin reductase (DIM6/NTAB) family NADH-FMN oxidoreductase RutF